VEFNTELLLLAGVYGVDRLYLEVVIDHFSASFILLNQRRLLLFILIGRLLNMWQYADLHARILIGLKVLLIVPKITLIHHCSYVLNLPFVRWVLVPHRHVDQVAYVFLVEVYQGFGLFF